MPLSAELCPLPVPAPGAEVTETVDAAFHAQP